MKQENKEYDNESKLAEFQDKFYQENDDKKAAELLWSVYDLLNHACRSALKTKLSKPLKLGIYTWEDDIYPQAEEMTLEFMDVLRKRRLVYKKTNKPPCYVKHFGNYAYWFIFRTNDNEKKLQHLNSSYIYETEKQGSYNAFEDDIIDRLDRGETCL